MHVVSMRIAVNSKMQESPQWLELTLAYFVAFFTFVLISCNTKNILIATFTI